MHWEYDFRPAAPGEADDYQKSSLTNERFLLARPLPAFITKIGKSANLASISPGPAVPNAYARSNPCAQACASLGNHH